MHMALVPQVSEAQPLDVVVGARVVVVVLRVVVEEAVVMDWVVVIALVAIEEVAKAAVVGDKEEVGDAVEAVLCTFDVEFVSAIVDWTVVMKVVVEAGKLGTAEVGALDLVLVAVIVDVLELLLGIAVVDALEHWYLSLH